MRMAVVFNGVVENIIEAEPSFNPGEGRKLVVAGGADIGWAWDGKKFIAPALVEPVEPIPDQIALWQARAVLGDLGMIEKADAAVAASGNHTLMAVWQYGNYITRSSPGVAALAVGLGLSSADIDALFIAANAKTA